MKLSNLKMVFSVGCAFDTESGNTFPINADSTIDFDNPVNVIECDTEWFGNLDLNDFDLVEDWFDKEDLDIRAMLTDELVFDNPKDEYDFNEAMNGMGIYAETYK